MCTLVKSGNKSKGFSERSGWLFLVLIYDEDLQCNNPHHHHQCKSPVKSSVPLCSWCAILVPGFLQDERIFSSSCVWPLLFGSLYARFWSEPSKDQSRLKGRCIRCNNKPYEQSLLLSMAVLTGFSRCYFKSKLVILVLTSVGTSLFNAMQHSVFFK